MCSQVELYWYNRLLADRFHVISKLQRIFDSAIYEWHMFLAK